MLAAVQPVLSNMVDGTVACEQKSKNDRIKSNMRTYMVRKYKGECNYGKRM